MNRDERDKEREGGRDVSGLSEWVVYLFLVVLELFRVGSLRCKLMLVFNTNRSAGFIWRVLWYPFSYFLRMCGTRLFKLGTLIYVRLCKPFALDDFGFFLFEFSIWRIRHANQRRHLHIWDQDRAVMQSKSVNLLPNVFHVVTVRRGRWWDLDILGQISIYCSHYWLSVHETSSVAL